MKKKYSNIRPYGEWLAENVVTLDTLLDSVPDGVKVIPTINEASMAPG